MSPTFTYRRLERELRPVLRYGGTSVEWVDADGKSDFTLSAADLWAARD
ncbi:hypothetical protein KRR26_07730 [Corallococcus sp. M34]|nr:hypothetical protein [Citreicoccus inhibens]MBU8895490.1 hypothetical protein [Citreicoccus inhibens]